VRPPFVYFGGKQVLADRIAALLPEHLHYVEPFCGSLAVLLAKKPSRMETVNDLDREVMTFWRILRDRPEDLERVCSLTPHSRAEYLEALHSEPTDDELETARRVWVRLTQGRAGQLRRTTGWRYFIAGRGSNRSMPGYLEAYRSRLGPCLDRLAQVSLECRPALETVTEYGKDPETLLYVDPPYLGETRNWGNQYRHEMRDEASHRELAAALLAARAAVVISGYPSPLYDELFAGWDRVSMATRTTQAGVDSERTEVLWSNRPLGNQPALFAMSDAPGSG
jgi:DNA adenine methylase